MKRREVRQIAVQALYQIEMTDVEAGQALENVLEGRTADEYLSELVTGVLQHRAELDDIIRRTLKNWKLERLSRVDRAVLRLAVYELVIGRSSPPAVIINEAVEIGKMFGTEESGKFINGVLSQVLKMRAED